MIFTLERVSNPDIEPVTLAEMKVHLGEFDSVTDRDSNLESLITAGREWAEEYTGRALVDQTWRLTIEQTPTTPVDSVSTPTRLVGLYIPRSQSEILLRRSPILTVDQVVTIDAAGDETVIAADTYQLRLATSKYPKLVALNAGSWSAEVTQITFRAGYVDRQSSPQQDATVVPARYKQAIKLWVEANYDRPTDWAAGADSHMDKLLKTAETLIRGERIDLSLA